MVNVKPTSVCTVHGHVEPNKFKLVAELAAPVDQLTKAYPFRMVMAWRPRCLGPRGGV